MKFMMNLKVLEVRVPPDIYEMMKRSELVKYDTFNDKMVWNDWKVIRDKEAKDIHFKFDHGITEEYDA